MEQLPADKIEKFQGESSSSSETESIVPIILEKLKVGSSPDTEEQDTDLEAMLPAIMENESEFDGSDLIAIPIDGRDGLSMEALIRAKKYSKITDEQRKEFIDAVEINGEKIINAAKRFNINYSSAKSILNVYKNEGRSIKKLTRNRGAKGQDEEGSDTQVIAEPRDPQNFSQKNADPSKSPTETFDASTQTQTQEDSQGDNYLLALRDRLIASKTEKRENPYSDSIGHDFARHTGSLGDYSQSQMATSGYDNAYSMDASRDFQFENKQPSPSQYMQQSTSYSSQPNNPQQQYSSNNSQSQSYQQQQQSLNSENRGVYSRDQQSTNQQQNFATQQDHKSQAQQYLIAQNNLDQQRLKSAAGYQNQLSNLGFSQPGSNNNDYSGMSYTGTGQSQYFSDSANDQKNMMQSNQVQYLQPIMYLMPSNFPGMGNQGGFLPSGLQGLQSLQGLQGIQGIQGIQGLQGLGNFVSMPNSYMLYGGNNQGQSQGGQGQGQNQGNQGQNQGQSQNQGQNQSQPQYQNQGQAQNQYQNQGQYYGPR